LAHDTKAPSRRTMKTPVSNTCSTRPWFSMARYERKVGWPFACSIYAGSNRGGEAESWGSPRDAGINPTESGAPRRTWWPFWRTLNRTGVQSCRPTTWRRTPWIKAFGLVDTVLSSPRCCDGAEVNGMQEH
jgi:hypothetical protein